MACTSTAPPLEVTGASYKDGYKISIEFSDGHRSEIDFKLFLTSSLNSETRQFLDPNRFKAFRIEWGDLVWGDYDMCFPLEDLYSGELIKSPLLAVAEESATYGENGRPHPHTRREPDADDLRFLDASRISR